MRILWLDDTLMLLTPAGPVLLELRLRWSSSGTLACWHDEAGRLVAVRRAGAG
jgi:hypothetical protein